MTDTRSEPAIEEDDEAEPSTADLREEGEQEVSTEEFRKQLTTQAR